MTLQIKLLQLLLTVLVVTGCAVGQNDFNCSAGDENALCASSRTIYKATDGELKENQEIIYVQDGEKKVTTLDELNEINGLGVNSASHHTTTAEQADMSAPFTFSYDGEVLRKDVKVLRVWVAPWVDNDGDLHLSKLVYTDIEERKWEVGSVNKNTSTLIKAHVKPVAAQK